MVVEAREHLVSSGVMPSIVGLLSDLEGDSNDKDNDEMVDVVDLVCALLLGEEARRQFVAAHGLEVCLDLIRKMQGGRQHATKILSFCLVDEATAAAFVSHGGLGVLFSLFMGLDIASYRQKYRRFDAQHDLEYILTICAGLVSHLPHEGAHGQRVLGKFRERDHEKVKRLVLLLSEYFDNLQTIGSESDKAPVVESCLFQSLLIARSLYAVFPVIFDGLLANQPRILHALQNHDMHKSSSID